MKGVYVLIIKVNKDMEIKVGALGNIRFKNGFYAYVGSAQRGLKNRINRHLTKIRKRNFWHIDYLLENNYTEVLEVFYKIADKSMECKIAQNLNKQTYQITNFGCSDCNCHSHLFKIKDYNFFRCLISEMKMFSLN